MKITLVLTLITLALPCYALAQQTLTLKESVNILYKVNETIEAAAVDIKASEYQKKAMFGLHFPKISVDSTYTFIDKPIDIDLGEIRSAMILTSYDKKLALALPPFVKRVQDDKFFNLSAQISLPLFTGGKIWAANEAAALNVDLMKAKKDDVSSKLVTTLTNYYFTVKLSNDIVQLRKNVLNAMQDHYNRALKMEKAGVLAKIETLYTEVAMSDAERAYNQSIRDALLASTALNSILNQKEPIVPTTKLFLVDEADIEELSFFQENAIKINPLLKQLGYAEGIRGAAIDAERAGYYPTIYLFGKKEIYTNDLTMLQPEWAAGIGLSYDIFEGFSNLKRVDVAKANKLSTQLTKVRAEKDIKTLIEQQYIAMQNAREDYKALGSSLQFSEEYLRARRKSFDQGMATSVDLVDAELALMNAKLQIILSAYKFDIALASLLETSGLSESFEGYREKAFVELEN